MNTQNSASATNRRGGCCCANKSSIATNTQDNGSAGTCGLPLQQLQVQGATCSGCVRSIEQTLRSVAGVTEACMDLGTGIASVVGMVESNDLIEALERAGFPAAVIN